MLKLSGEITAFGWGFAWQTKLKTITIPNSITSIGEYSFSDCTGLTSVNVPNNVTNIGEQAFLNCTGLTSIIIPGSVTTIAQETFQGCTGLTSVTLPDSVTSIGNRAFQNCTGITSITIPDSVTSIGSESFRGCTSLSHIVVDSNNPKYDNRNDCNAIIETATNTLVAGCKNTVIPNSVTAIGSGAFADCRGLITLTVPNSVTAIGSSAFAYCRGLITLTVPNTVTDIGGAAFYAIPNVIYSGSATGSPWGARTVNGYIDGDFVYTDNTKANLVDYIGNGGSVIIPNTVTTFNIRIFDYVTITSIVFGNNVSAIPAYMFDAKQNLASITINNGIIGEYAFLECTELTSLIFGNGNISIGEGAFYNCTGLTSITIPNNVTSINSWAFGGCTGLSSITCLGSTPLTLTKGEFDETNDCPIYVPAASVDVYKSAWSSYASRIQAIQS